MKIHVKFHGQKNNVMQFREVHPFGNRPEASADPFFNVGMAERQSKWDEMDRQLKTYNMQSRQVKGLMLMDGPFFTGETYYAELIDSETVAHPQ